MAIIDEHKWTHKGWFCSCVPVYFDETTDALSVRHWCFEPWMDVVEIFFAVVCQIKVFIDPEYEPQFPILITAELHYPN